MRRQLQRRCGSLRSGWCQVAWCWFGWLWTRIWSSVRHRYASIPAGLGLRCMGRRSARRSIVLALRHEVLRGGVVGLGGQHVPALAVEPDADVVEDRVLELTREMATLGIAVTVGDRSPLVSRRHHAAAADRSEGRGGPIVTGPEARAGRPASCAGGVRGAVGQVGRRRSARKVSTPSIRREPHEERRPRPFITSSRRVVGVFLIPQDVAVDDVGQPTFEGAARFGRRLALGQVCAGSRPCRGRDRRFGRRRWCGAPSSVAGCRRC